MAMGLKLDALQRLLLLLQKLKTPTIHNNDHDQWQR